MDGRRSGWKAWASAREVPETAEEAPPSRQRPGWRNWAEAQPVRREGVALAPGELLAEVRRVRREKVRAVEEEEYEEAAVLKRQLKMLEAALRELGGEEAVALQADAQATEPAAQAAEPVEQPAAAQVSPPAQPVAEAAAAAVPAAMRVAQAAPTAVAGSSVQPAGPDGVYIVAHDRLAVRSSPSTRGRAITVVKHGKKISGAPYDIDGSPWLRLDDRSCEELEIEDEGCWVLMHGRCVGLGELLKREEPEAAVPAVPAEELPAAPPAFGAAGAYSAYRVRGGHSDSEESAEKEEEDDWDAVNQCWRSDVKEEAKEEEDWEGWEDEEWWEEEEEEEEEHAEDKEEDEAAEEEQSGVGRREEVGGSLPRAAKDPPAASSAELDRLSAGIEAALEAEDVETFKALLKARYELYRSQGDFALALEDADSAVDLDPEDAAAVFRRGVARLEVGGQDQPALADFRAAQRLGSQEESLTTWIRRARHWSGQGNRKNHYAALGATADCSAAQLKQAYRRAALRWHPDKPGGDTGRFRAAKEAWEALSDPGKREAYDFGEAARPRPGGRPTAARRAPTAQSAPQSAGGFFVPPPRQHAAGRMPPGGWYVPPSKYSSGGGASPGYAQQPKAPSFRRPGPRMSYSTGGFGRACAADRA